MAEIGTIVLVGVLITLGIIIIVLILLAAGFFWWRHKRSQLEFVEPCDDHETSSASLKFQQLLETQQQEQLLEEQKKQQQAQQTTPANKINSKLNGFLNLKTPLIGSPNHPRKPRKLPKNTDGSREMWAAMTRSLEMIVALFEYYSATVTGTNVDEVPPPTLQQEPASTSTVLLDNASVSNLRSSSQIKSPAGSSSGDGDSRAVGNANKDNATNRSVSMVDMYIDNSEPTENVGQIQFSLEYDFQNTTLILKVIQAKEVRAMDIGGTSDPYCRVTLLPDKKHRLETKIKRRTLHPRWNETFYFEGFPLQKLASRVVHLHVFDYDRFSRDDSIGEVFMPLCQIELTNKPLTFWKALRSPSKDKCGELLCSLCYHPSNSILTLTLVKARNLKAKDINGKSDPYTKVWLQFGEKRIEKRKTPIFKCNLNPHFNESFSFNVPWEKIRECSLDVMVLDFDNIGRNELIGRILLAGKNGSGAVETKHWQDMISKPRQTIVQWHRLKPE